MIYQRIVSTAGVAVILVTVSVFSLAAEEEKPDPVRVVPIPKREHGYSAFKSTVLSSEKDLATFLKSGPGKGGGGWNERAAFEKALADAKIDFAREVLVLLRHTEGSGSVSVTPQKPRVVDRSVTFEVARKQPDIGTADMAFYCFALAIAKADVDEVVFLNGKGKREVLALKAE